MEGVPDPDVDAKLDRIEYALTHRPERTFAFDEFGPLGIRPTAGSGWAAHGRPNRLPATYHRTHGITYLGPLGQAAPAHPATDTAIPARDRFRARHSRGDVTYVDFIGHS
ncbi:hypothetical protein SAMN05421833_105316 [Microbispora rosea]|uniref:DDE superfamily endonuclease n=1 Tax=Microbispora rosea TaxID=58117 RepID=A0A1N6XX17_9ACTN|nr:hypothetical protein [Microbispora rosea]GIH51129.1 hypothetical protein Mro03_63080 [Microbispora rosea subsp. rosea]SIR06773.1 hypothetical protein SAMN05421833_105316 [Microbispora rosea]